MVPTRRKGNRLETSIKCRSDLNVRDLGSEMIIYDEQAETFHILNKSARCIWLMLDGESGPRMLQERYASLYPTEDRARLVNDLRRTVEEFDRRGLLLTGALFVPVRRSTSH